MVHGLYFVLYHLASATASLLLATASRDSLVLPHAVCLWSWLWTDCFLASVTSPSLCGEFIRCVSDAKCCRVRVCHV